MMVRTVTWLGLAAFVIAAGSLLTFGSERIHAQSAVQAPEKPGGEAASKIPAALPPDVAFGRFIALIRGHLLTGEELVKQRDWSDAHAHFMFPLEEIYGVIREDLRSYKTPPFDAALKALARTVQRRSVKQYAKARAKVEDALAAADVNLKGRQPNWPRFELTVAIEMVKAAAEEYEDAITNGRIAHPVGYRTARGFILQADRMIDSVAGELAAKNAEALRDLREGLSQLKQAFATVDAPKRPPIDDAALLGIIARIEQAAGKLT
jgi:hypothetical protein